MPLGKEEIILAYNGVDGFCSAAMALLRFPKARIVMTSAAKIGGTFGKLNMEKKKIGRIHVCGLGIYCNWEEVLVPGRELKERGTDISWYCGRGYMDGWRDKLEEICTPVFIKCPTNTAALCRHFALEGQLWAGKLLSIAMSDPNVKGSRADQPVDIADWRDYIRSAISGYLKYQDEEVCPAVIEKLTRLELSREDREAARIYRKVSKKNILRGSSEKLKEVRRLIARYAKLDEQVIITGESGTGKEYAAQLIHEGSKRAGEHFQVVNCAIFAGNAGLANSTLFGHVKGAFTGATGDRKGAFRKAHTGTLFLDELGLLPLEVQ
ncbi:MAG: sigma 54-interacting transcriptional regulator, partial [Gemmatimonadota bacterium]|nr:sigma 54-interacting transcriptional regulator [Gemmatimonadota bacterium]